MAIVSPCVRNCCLDTQDVCLGCGRHVEEIIRWGEAGDDERKQILERSKQRLQEIKEKRSRLF